MCTPGRKARECSSTPRQSDLLQLLWPVHVSLLMTEERGTVLGRFQNWVAPSVGGFLCTVVGVFSAFWVLPILVAGCKKDSSFATIPRVKKG